MLNLTRRVKQLEGKMGLTEERYILLICCADPKQRLAEGQHLGVEVSPGIYALVYDGELSSDELVELREQYRRRSAQPSDHWFDAK